MTFQTVLVEEPSLAETLSILRGIKEKYELHHGVRIADSALSAAAKLSLRYITDRSLPDKAIDLIDQTAAAARIALSSKPEEIDKLDRQTVQMEIELRALKDETDKQAEERVRVLTQKLAEVKEKSRDLTEKWEREKRAHTEVQEARKKLEEARREMEQKVREEDFARVAELQYKVIPAAEKVMADYGDLDLSDEGPVRRVVDEMAVLALDTHRALEGALRQWAEGGRGSTGRGISPAYADVLLRHPVRIRDLAADDWRERLGRHYDLYAALVRGLDANLAKVEVPRLNSPPVPVGSRFVFLDRLGAQRSILLPFVSSAYDFLREQWADPAVPFIFEGAQGDQCRTRQWQGLKRRRRLDQ